MKNSTFLIGLAALCAVSFVSDLIYSGAMSDKFALFTIVFTIGACICNSIEQLPELLVAEHIPDEDFAEVPAAEDRNDA